MKALILRGKYAGHEVEVEQWCNDWFMVRALDDDKELTEADRRAIAVKPFSPTALVFKHTDMLDIKLHKNNGMLFGWFETKPIANLGAYEVTFKKRQL